MAAAMVHIQYLTVGGSDIAVDRERGHALKHIVSDDKKAVVANLRRLAKAGSPQGVYLTTDPDQEGEAHHSASCRSAYFTAGADRLRHGH